MPIYELLQDKIRAIQPTSFGAAGVKERGDLQRLLRTQIEVLAPDGQFAADDHPYLVIAEEFSEWEDCKRRIDLLAIDKDANLVVIELKRTEDGGHMELQALRYAAMISTMTFERTIEVYADYLKATKSSLDARTSVLEFLDWDEPDEERFAKDVRIVLAGADFSKELTTTVLWLGERGLDIRCIRIKPYDDNGRVFLDVQQVIPLPEAAEYQIKIKEKQQRERASRHSAKDLTKYDVTIGGTVRSDLPKRQAIFTVIKQLCDRGVSPEQIAAGVTWRRNSMFWKIEGTFNSEEFLLKAGESKSNGKKFDPLRYFTGNDELIRSGGNTYAVSNQWGHRTFEAIKCLITQFPDKQITCAPIT